jgi:hypothetical protein
MREILPKGLSRSGLFRLCMEYRVKLTRATAKCEGQDKSGRTR